VVTGPDLVLRLAALLHDIGKPATRTFESGGGVSFHHHELVGARLVTKRLKAMRYDKAQVTDVARLVELHLRFHGYGEGQWTDSAVRRYVTDAGPLLGRLHLLTRSDCTTRNVRKATRSGRTYDELEVRIAAARGRRGARRDPPRARREPDRGGAGHQARPGARRGLQVPARRAPGRGADRAGGRRGTGSAPVVGQKCDSQSGQGAGCTITTTGKGSSVELGFILNPEKDRNDFSDHYLFNGSKDGVASFSAMRQDFTCRQGETIPVGRGFADCLEVGEDHFKVRIYVGDPPRQ
jgi:putative nucleotidyltransferase with HDIG domain